MRLHFHAGDMVRVRAGSLTATLFLVLSYAACTGDLASRDDGPLQWGTPGDGVVPDALGAVGVHHYVAVDPEASDAVDPDASDAVDPDASGPVADGGGQLDLGNGSNTPCKTAPKGYPFAATGAGTCYIKLVACPNHPTVTLNKEFSDTWDGADKDLDRCLARSTDHHVWCGAGRDQHARARWVLYGKTVGSALARSSTRCQIQVKTCSQHTDITTGLKPFHDLYQDADMDPQRCLKRANEYFKWCGDAGNQVFAKFYLGQTLLASAVSVTGNDCVPAVGYLGKTSSVAFTAPAEGATIANGAKIAVKGTCFNVASVTLKEAKLGQKTLPCSGGKLATTVPWAATANNKRTFTLEFKSIKGITEKRTRTVKLAGSAPAIPSTRLGLLNDVVGFGHKATGGASGKLYHVTTLADSGPGSLRAALQDVAPLWVVFDVSGSIHLKSNLNVTSNKTIDGRGANVTVCDDDLVLKGVSNVIVENLSFQDSEDDAIKIQGGATNIWVDHCSLRNASDGLIDITKAVASHHTDATVSWCHFSNHDKVMLVGASVADSDDVNLRVTLHHNHFEQTTQRHPRLRYGKVHAFNNYLEKWGSYGMGSSQKGELYGERNIFEAGGDKDGIIVQIGNDPDKGYVNVVGGKDWLINGAKISENESGKVFNAADYYPYTVEDANAAMKSAIQNNAGWRNITP